jgi:hypothetical protein
MGQSLELANCKRMDVQTVAASLYVGLSMEFELSKELVQS